MKLANCIQYLQSFQILKFRNIHFFSGLPIISSQSLPPLISCRKGFTSILAPVNPYNPKAYRMCCRNTATKALCTGREAQFPYGPKGKPVCCECPTGLVPNSSRNSCVRPFSAAPTHAPTRSPTRAPTPLPSTVPTPSPTRAPTPLPTATRAPTESSTGSTTSCTNCPTKSCAEGFENRVITSQYYGLVNADLCCLTSWDKYRRCSGTPTRPTGVFEYGPTNILTCCECPPGYVNDFYYCVLASAVLPTPGPI